MKRIFQGIVLLGLLASAPAAADGSELTVTVVDLRNDKGHVRFGLYDRENDFPSSAGVIKSGVAPIAGGRAFFVFRDLPPGSYAVTVFHDEDDDGKFDRSLIGLPLEGYGFSNDAKVFLAPPSFREAAFSVGEADASVVIRIVY